MFEVTATRRRPQQFESLAGQEFVVSTLKNAIEQGRIAHAYLFSGPRGVGKTTSARLLAKALNCQHGPTAEPCGECENCRGIAKGNSIDVIEIDGASNTGVNDIRVIKEEVLFPPVSSRYKIYIIDEVHMLSQSAFNALLKTIEEPPEYVIFIFATTETQKVPATIRSRCQQFNFQLIPIETIKKLLKEAADEIGIEAEDDALFWIAKESTGSMRDAYTLFDQVVSFSKGRITLDGIREKLGLVGVDVINSVMTDLLESRRSRAIEKLEDLLARGVSVDQIVKDFTDYFRSLLLIKEGVQSENVLGQRVDSFPPVVKDAYSAEQLDCALDMFLNLYRNIRYSLNPRFELELTVAKLARLRYVASNAVVVEQIARLKNDLINGTITPVNPQLQNEKDIEPDSVSINPDTVVKEEVVVQNQSLDNVMPAGVVNHTVSDTEIVLEFGKRFFYEAALREYGTISGEIKKIVGEHINVVLKFSEPCENPSVAEEPVAVEVPSVETPSVETLSVETLSVETPTEKAPHKEDFLDDLIYAFKGHEER